MNPARHYAQPALKLREHAEIVRVLSECDRLKEAANRLGVNVRTLRNYRVLYDLPRGKQGCASRRISA